MSQLKAPLADQPQTTAGRGVMPASSSSPGERPAGPGTTLDRASIDRHAVIAELGEIELILAKAYGRLAQMKRDLGTR